MNRASPTYSKFEHILLQYINIVAPIIRSLWSLEAAHANASDVFVFWLAIAATLKDLFSKGSENTGIANSLAREITAIFNKRYNEFFTNEVYFVAFALHPREFHIIFLIGYAHLTDCSLRIPTFRIPQKAKPGSNCYPTAYSEKQHKLHSQ